MEEGLATTGAQPVHSFDRTGRPHFPKDPVDDPESNSVDRLQWAMSVCERLGLRMTDARRAVLAFLADRQTPVSLSLIERGSGIGDRFDAATIYRTVILLKELEIVRQINADHKLRYFVLNSPDESSAYLICQCCGKVISLEAVPADERRVEQAVGLGYIRVQRLIELRGLCPRCQTKPGINTHSTKLPVKNSGV